MEQFERYQYENLNEHYRLKAQEFIDLEPGIRETVSLLAQIEPEDDDYEGEFDF